MRTLFLCDEITHTYFLTPNNLLMPSLALQYFVEKSSEFQDAAKHSEYADVIAQIENSLRAEGFNIDSAGEAVIQVLFVDTAHLADKAFYNRLCNCPELRLVNNASYRPKPIITIGVFDIMDIYEEGPGLGINTKEEDFDWRAKRTADHILYAMHLDHRVKFLDSSIWHRYVPVKPSDGATFENKLKHVLDKMLDYYEQGLYHSVAAVTTLEFNCRMLLNSFIEKAGEKGHHEAVTPFKFHSETVMEKKAEALLNFLKTEREQDARLSNLEWNILMVDDHSDRPLSTVDGVDATKHPSKKQIIEKALQGNDFQGVNIVGFTRGDTNIINNGIELLKEQSFDIILLDYLLGESELNPALKAYGHEFLLEMTTGEKQHQLRRGPMGRFWIYPISSFPHAFTDKLRQLNIDGSNRRWHIANGGDPVSTPELFRVNFYRLLLRQITEYYLHEAALVRWAAQFNGIEDKDMWCKAVELQILGEQQKIELLRSYRDGSVFLYSIEDFLYQQPGYQALWRHLSSWINLAKKHPIKERDASELLEYLFSFEQKKFSLTLFDQLKKQFIRCVHAESPSEGKLLNVASIETDEAQALPVFISSAYKSRRAKSKLEEHLASLIRGGLIRILSEDDILPGKDMEKTIEEMLQKARIMVPLIDSHYWSDDKNVAMINNILDRQESNIEVIPVNYGPMYLGEHKLAKLKMLPNSRPVQQWKIKDKAWETVAVGIRRVVEDILEKDRQHQQ